jgi:hypothetical protein
MKFPPTRRAFLLADVLVGLSIVAMLAGLLAVAVNRQHMAAQRLADLRSAQRLAENVLLNLQHHQPVPTAPADATIQIDRTTTGTAPTGFTWTIVQTRVNAESTKLIGLAPTGERS